jgi:hypothetical protein
MTLLAIIKIIFVCGVKHFFAFYHFVDYFVGVEMIE